MLASLVLASVILNAPKPPEPRAPEEPKVVEPSVVPPVVPETHRFRRRTPGMRADGWGFTAAFGVTGLGLDSGALSWGGFAGPRLWLGENQIVSFVLAPQQTLQADRGLSSTDVAALARFEIATSTEEDRAFPSFSLYAGAGPELATSNAVSRGGVRAVFGLHLPSGFAALGDQLRKGDNPWVLAAMLLLPTTVEVQVHKSPGADLRVSFLAGLGF